jgi:hypothetical protein
MTHRTEAIEPFRREYSVGKLARNFLQLNQSYLHLKQKRGEMKSSVVLTGSLATAMALACAACTKTQPSDAIHKDVATTTNFADYLKSKAVVQKKINVFIAGPDIVTRALNIAPMEEEFITRCDPAALPNATRMVKLRINGGFDVKNTGRDVVSKKPGGAGAKPVPEPTLNLNSTTYDLKLDKTIWDATGQILAVKILLKDGDMIFLDEDHSVTTVKSPPGASSMFICLSGIKSVEDKDDSAPDDESDTGKDKWQSVTFYVNEPNRRLQKFNIRLVVFQKKHPYVLPIILDPEIENTGFQ